MIRVRTADGQIHEFGDGIVEIHDGKTVAFAAMMRKGEVTIVEPNTPEGKRYARMFGITWATEHVTLPSFLTEVKLPEK